MNCARAIFVLLALFQYSWAAASPEATALASSLRCYVLLYKDATQQGVVKPDSTLNVEAMCAVTQSFVDCLDEAEGIGFTLDVNRVISWQMCRSIRVLGMCPRAKCNALRKKSVNTDYWKNLALPASKGRPEKCAKPLNAECNRMYMDALVNMKSMVPYYLCYVNGHKTCRSGLLAPLAQIYSEAMTPDSPVNKMFVEAKVAFEEFYREHGN